MRAATCAVLSVEAIVPVVINRSGVLSSFPIPIAPESARRGSAPGGRSPFPIS